MHTTLVTGGTGGIGLEVATQLGARGHSLLLVGRDVGRGDTAVRALADRGITATFHSADLSTVAGVDDLVARISRDHPGLDRLVANVGALLGTASTTDDGIDTVAATNAVCPTLLLDGLAPVLASNPHARAAYVTSAAVRGARESIDTAMRPFRPLRVYGRSKAWGSLAFLGLARRLEGAIGVDIVDPGATATSLSSLRGGGFGPVFRTLIGGSIRLLQRDMPVEDAARSAVVAMTTDGAFPTGRWIDRDGIVIEAPAWIADPGRQDQALSAVEEAAGRRLEAPCDER